MFASQACLKCKRIIHTSRYHNLYTVGYVQRLSPNPVHALTFSAAKSTSGASSFRLTGASIYAHHSLSVWAPGGRTELT